MRGTFPQVGNHLWKIFRHFGEGEKDNSRHADDTSCHPQRNSTEVTRYGLLLHEKQIKSWK
ncbi:MAG: hypothetical protein ACK5N4_08380 [Parabacteroides gordonii]|uniref:hypothetical protein n=1 Tax=Parabacteroides gordonii TaxID=574930 RepID=UPI003A8570D8